MHSTYYAEQRSAPRPAAAAIPELRAALLGEVVAPGDPEYESARLVVNAAVDRRPALIVRPADSADVALAVSLARTEGLELAVRGGGHSFAGHGTTDGGLVLDMSKMRALHVDPQRRIAWAQAGLTAGQYTAEAARHGLTTGFGDTGSVGIAGLTLGGGIGWLVRKHGLTIDDLLAVELVTADGERLRADSDRHPDLFWALRSANSRSGSADGSRSPASCSAGRRCWCSTNRRTISRSRSSTNCATPSSARPPRSFSSRTTERCAAWSTTGRR